jgi:hypothetical protein
MADETMVLNRKTGEAQPVQEFVMPTRKQIRKNFLPNVGDIVGGCKVIYINDGQFRFTAEGNTLPPSVGIQFDFEGKIYEIERIDEKKKRYNAVFRGYKQNVAPPDVEEDTELVKMI